MNLRYVAIKVLRAIITLWMVVTFIFIVLRVSGDPIDTLLPDDSDAETIAYYMHEWGLDRPLHEQYGLYFVSVFKGDFGVSFIDDRKALEVVVERIPATLQLGFAAFVFGVCVGIPLGIVAALNRNSAIDRAMMTTAVLGYAIPNFFLGILLILVFTLWPPWLPSPGSAPVGDLVVPQDFDDKLDHGGVLGVQTLGGAAFVDHGHHLGGDARLPRAPLVHRPDVVTVGFPGGGQYGQGLNPGV